MTEGTEAAADGLTGVIVASAVEPQAVAATPTGGGAAQVECRNCGAVPAVHMYRQLRGAYGLSRRGALVRLFFLLIAATMVLIIFVSLLLVIGVLG